MKQRQSNMELLRIVSIFMIVLFHCAFRSGFSFEAGFDANKLVVKSFWMLGELGVNLFMMISGYFMVNGRFRWKKLILLLAEVQFYYWLMTLVSWKLGIGTLPEGKDLFLAFFPVIMNHWWFITAYILVYVLSPYLNTLAKAMDIKTFRSLIVTLLVLFSVIPTFFGLFANNAESVLDYTRFVWLVVVYFMGACMSRSEPKSTKFYAWLSVISAAALVGSILLIEYFRDFFAMLGTTEVAYFWAPNTVPMVTLTFGVFGLFRKLEVPYNPVINKIASTTLGIYLLSDGDGPIPPWIWESVFRSAQYTDYSYLFLRMIWAAVVVCAVSAAIDLLRQWLMKPLSKGLDRLLAGGFRWHGRTQQKDA